MTSGTNAHRLGRYHLTEPLGGGPTGEVFRAKVYGVAGFERDFALKRFHSALVHSPSAAAKLATAARFYGSLKHTNIARVNEFGVAGSETFLATEFIQGIDLNHLASAAGGTLEPGPALDLMAVIARAVSSVHARGHYHLGLCPTNVLIAEGVQPKITDFGVLPIRLGRRPAQDSTLDSRIPYLAPEQLAGEPTSAATDVYQLGVITFELMAGHRPFDGGSGFETAQQILSGKAVEAELPKPVARIIRRCLARSPFERFPDAGALADALDEAKASANLTGDRFALADLVKDEITAREAIAPEHRQVPESAPPPEPAAKPDTAAAAPRVVRVSKPKSALQHTMMGASPAELLKPRGQGLAIPPAASVPPASKPPASVPPPASKPPASMPPPTVGRPTATAPRRPPAAPPEPAAPVKSAATDPISERIARAEPKVSGIAPTANTAGPSKNALGPVQPATPIEAPNLPRRGTVLPGLTDREKAKADELIRGLVKKFDSVVTELPKAASSPPNPSPASSPPNPSTAEPSAQTGPRRGSAAAPATPRANRTLPIVLAIVVVAGVGLLGYRQLVATPEKVAASAVAPPTSKSAEVVLDAAVSHAADTTRTPDAAPDNLPPPPAKKPTKLTINVEPKGAKVYIDGTKIGNAPITIDATSDSHRLAVIKAGYDLHVADISGSGTVDVKLKEVTPSGGSGGIKVRCKKKNRYYVFVDGKPSGQLCRTERIGVRLGKHVVEIYDPITDSRREFPVTVKSRSRSLRVRVD